MNSDSFNCFGPKHLAEMKRGLVLYNQRKFWECHEELEDLWLEARGSNIRYIYWAVIQVAISLFHCVNGNEKGAMSMIQKAQRKIVLCEKLKLETILMEKFLDWSRFKSLVKLQDFDALMQFKFLDPDKW